MEVPGQVGWSISGDKTYEFARTPLDFVGNRIKKHKSKVFIARVLNKPHVFVTSNAGIREMLIEKGSSFDMAYKDFGYMYDLYGDIFLFNDDEESFRLREIVQELFHHENCNFYMIKIQRLTKHYLKDISLRSSVEIYELFKKLTTAICLSVFLDIDDDKKLEDYKAIATTHWHGLISVPVSVKVKGWASSFNKAAEAKAQLLAIIKHQLHNKEEKGRFLECVHSAGFEDVEQASIHLLLFVSAIIPKALSSLLTSFVIETEGESMSDLRESASKNEQVLNDIMLEIQRLWPPLYGGRRIAKEDVVIDGYQINSGSYVAYISRYGNRDENVFDQPNTFLPNRWQEQDKDKKNLVWTFGGGKRSCIGIGFINRIVNFISTYLLSQYRWEIQNDQIPPYKTLPVARPKESVHVTFKPRQHCNGDK